MLYLSTFVLILALLCAQILIGGARMLYSIPAYGLVALAGLLVVSRLKWIKTMPGWGCLASALLLVAYLLGRELTSPVEYLARPDFLMVSAVFVTYLLTALWLVRPGMRLAVITCLLIFALAQVLVGIIQFSRGDNFMPLPWIIRTQYGARASGFYVCPNHLAGLLEVLGAFGLSILFWSKWRLTARLAVGYLAFMCYAGLAITGSRGGYLSTAISLLTFFILSLVAVRRVAPYQFAKLLFGMLAAVTAAAVAALAVIYNSNFLTGRFHAIMQYHDVRLLIWASALKAHALFPWFGTGAGMFLYWGRHFREVAVQNDPIFVHNDYLHLLTEYGIAGAVCMAVMLATHLTSGLRWYQRITKSELAPRGEAASNRLALQIGSLSAIAAYLAHSVVDFNLHIPANALLMAFIFGIIANPGRENEPEPGDEPPLHGKWLAFAVPVLSVGLALISLPKFAGEYYGELARASLRDKHWTEAMNYADAAFFVEKKNPNLYYYLAEAKRVTADGDEDLEKRIEAQMAAEQLFKTGLALFPHDLDILLKLGRLYDTIGDYANAEKTYQLAIDADPNFGTVYAFYGLHFHVQGRVQEAKEQYEHALRLSGNPVAEEGLREIAAFEQKQKEQAKSPQPSLRSQLLEMEQQVGKTPVAPLPVAPTAQPSPGKPGDSSGY